MTPESSLRADLVEVGRRMYARGYTASNDGNLSVRLGSDRLLMTPKSVCKGFMTPDMMCITDLEGRKLQGDRDPSSEMLMHLEVYRQRPDVNAVVHAHPPIATGFAVAGIPLDKAVLAEVVTTLGKPGVQVASITKRPTGYVFAHVEGSQRPSVNGIPLTGESIALRSGDLIELAGTQMQFVQT